MAAPKSTSNDLIQIVMLTLFLCALFFGGWGGYVWLQVSEAEDNRLKEERSATQLDKLLKDPKNKDAIRNYRLVRKSQEQAAGAGGLPARIGELNKIKEDVTWIVADSEPKPKDLDDGVKQIQYKIDFGVRPLMNYVDFFYELELECPHIMVEDVSLTRKRTKDDPDGENYSGTVMLITYTGGGQ